MSEMEQITPSIIDSFGIWLYGEDKSEGTRKKYIRDVRAYSKWLDGRKPERDTASEWKEYLVSRRYAPVTINSMLGAINCFFRFMGMQIKIKFIKIQRCIFRDRSKELNENEYRRLVNAADKKKKSRLSLLMETICAMGIRVSEVKYITVEAAKSGRVRISLKGKIRIILIPKKLCEKLMAYAGKHKIASGEVFLTRSGKSISRVQIWSDMKKLCKAAKVEMTKVFPHNLRHLFATTFYNLTKDVVRLADVLGHSSIDTTRIYLLTTGEEHLRIMENMKLIM